eukprot:TRINITY_DN4705_c3_g1_i1.p1 TRINITY_DN4705_c3_g1~~TRINITY_DN4705_c3_g1_i1.p1  ORF type:complete len:525 (-),score=95.68 TRINITY_DN4705_c3_g1_i1:38-1588(-)
MSSSIVVESREWVPPLRCNEQPQHQEQEQQEESVPLSLIDATVPPFPIGFLTCFEATTSTTTTPTTTTTPESSDSTAVGLDALRRSLGALMRDARVLAGELVLGERVPHILLTDRGCELVVARCSDASVTRSSFNVDNWPNLPLELYGGQTGMEAFGRWTTRDAALLQVTLTTLVDGTRVLAVTLHHKVGDLGALVATLRVWSLRCAQVHDAQSDMTPLPIDVRPMWDRDVFASDVVVDIANQPPPPLREVQVRATPTAPRSPPPKSGRAILHFSDVEIDQCRASAESGGEHVFSRNDVVTVHTMRAVARAREMDAAKSEPIRCFFPVDMRRRLGLAGYIGNCFTYQAVDFMSDELLVNCDKDTDGDSNKNDVLPLAPLYRRVREAVVASDKAHFRRFVDWIASVEDVSQVQQRWRGMGTDTPGPDVLLTSSSYVNRDAIEAMFAPIGRLVGGKLCAFAQGGAAMDGFAYSISADVAEYGAGAGVGAGADAGAGAGVVVMLGLKADEAKRCSSGFV